MVSGPDLFFIEARAPTVTATINLNKEPDPQALTPGAKLCQCAKRRAGPVTVIVTRSLWRQTDSECHGIKVHRVALALRHGAGAWSLSTGTRLYRYVRKPMHSPRRKHCKKHTCTATYDTHTPTHSALPHTNAHTQNAP